MKKSIAKIKDCSKCPHYRNISFNYDLQNSKFSLKFLRKGFDLSGFPEEKAAFFDTIKKLSELTWVQIYKTPKHGLGCEKIDRKSITGDSIPDVVDEDTTIIAFRYNGKKAMVGFREKDTFFILWFDREYKLYNHG